MDRSIIHLNIADFAVAVETSRQPKLADRPLIIAPQGAPRAVVYDMSEAAFQQGIRKGMPLSRARRLNKKIKILPPRFNHYEQVMRRLFKETCTFTPLIESGTTDGHLYLDVTGSSRLFGPSVDVAFKLKKTFKNQFNLDPIWSVASNKLVAKVATRVVKPMGEYIVAPGEERAFLAPLPIDLIPGIAGADVKKLHEFNLYNVAQTRSLTLDQLAIAFHHRAPQIYQHIRGIDLTPIGTAMTASHHGPDPLKKPVRLFADHEFKNDTNTLDALKKGLYHACETIGRALRQMNRSATAACVTLSYSDGRQNRARSSLPLATSYDMPLFRQTFALLDKAWTRRVRIRHLRLEILHTRPDHVQADLFMPQTKALRQNRLAKAMDAIRKKFGASAVSSGLTLIPENGTP